MSQKRSNKFNIDANSLLINNLPFYWRVGNKTIIENIPTRLDFSLYFDSNYDCARQIVTPLLNESLIQVYKQNENIGYLRQDNTLAIKYHDDLLKFILNSIPDISNKNVLEIGCGGCTILNELKKRNVNVLGIDPSPFALECANKFNIKIINEFFDKNLIVDNYDLTYFSDVLEHVNDPMKFLTELSSTLPDGSKIIVAVPNATIEQEMGDISMCMHQHITYFTKKSLQRTFHKAGLHTINIVSSGYGGSLYGLAEVNKNSTIKINDSSIDNHSEIKEYKYFNKIENVIENFRSILLDSLSNGSIFYCYCPLRAIPYLAALGQTSNPNIRFIDDTPYWNNGYIDGSEIMIRSLNDSEISRNDVIFIFTNTFTNTIRSKLNSNGFHSNKIFSLSNLYS